MRKPHQSPCVYLTRCNNISDTINQTLAAIPGLDTIDRGDLVLLKPNICRSVDPDGHRNTNLKVLQAVIRYVKTITPKVMVGESDSSKGTALYKMHFSGTLDLLGKEGVPFLNLSTDTLVPVSHHGITEPMAQTLNQVQLLIDIPKIKMCEHTLIAGALKNLFGLVARGDKWTGVHLTNRLDDYIVFSALAAPPHIVLVDGLAAMEGRGPIGGTKVDLNLILAGTDAVSTDTVIAHLIGLNPTTIQHLVTTHHYGIGTLNLNAITLLGEPLHQHQRRLTQPHEVPPIDPHIHDNDHPYWQPAMVHALTTYGPLPPTQLPRA